MVLHQERTTRLYRPEFKSNAPSWVLWILVAAVVAVAVTLALVVPDDALDPTYQLEPEYEVDTLANPAVAAVAGGPIVFESRYLGSDANLDPDTPQWWMPEYAQDTLADPSVAALAGGPISTIDHYVGSSADELDPNVGE